MPGAVVPGAVVPGVVVVGMVVTPTVEPVVALVNVVAVGSAPVAGRCVPELACAHGAQPSVQTAQATTQRKENV